MDDKTFSIKARIKTKKQIAEIYPSAKIWGTPLDDFHWCHSADEAILPYLGKTVEVMKRRMYSSEFYFEIKDSGGIIVKPEWIDHFDSEILVPPAKYKNPRDLYAIDDIWLDFFEPRFMIIDEIMIVTG